MKAKTQVKEESVSMMNTPTLYGDRDNPRGTDKGVGALRKRSPTCH